jgi:mannose-6-phosphate isomerase-like protein (cupin superfamily)
MKITTVNSPGGYFEQFMQNERSTVELLHIPCGRRLSKQYHTNSTEFWRTLKGPLIIHQDEKESILNTGECATNPAGTIHRLEALEDGNAMILEISFGCFDGVHIVRIVDDYGPRMSDFSNNNKMPILCG